PRVNLPSSLFDAVALPGLPRGDWSGIALAIVIVASVESLLSAVAVDQLATTRGWRGPRVDLDRELLGQGSANLASGLVGGLPITGVIVRSSTNVASGGRTRKSAVLHGVWVLLFAVFLGRAVEWIPLSALAGLLVVGARLVDVAHLRHVRRHGELPVYLVTIVGVVALDLLQGVALGLLTALALVLRRVLWSSVRLVRTDELWQVEVEGTLSFLSLPRLARILGRIPVGAPVSIELIVDYLDHAAYEHLRGWCANHEASGGTVSVDEVGQVWFRRPAEVAEQRRRTVVPHLPRWFAPWSQWQELELASSPSDSHSSESRSSDSQPGGVVPPAIHPDPVPDPAASVPAQASPDLTVQHVSTMLLGVNEFHRRAAPLLRGTFDELAGGQQPGALFLTCADSRIVPNIITSSGPGDLFTIRNVGNIVPVDDPAGSDPDAPLRRGGDLSVTAALDYAVDVLRVPSLVVCGHSGCGAMQALLSGALDGAPDSALAGWLSHAAASLERTPPAGTEDLLPVERLGRANVAQQLENLRAHPAVRRALARGTLELVGLYFDIADARIWVLEESTGRFVDPMDALPTAVIGTGPRRRWDAPVRVPAPMVAVGAGPADEQPPPAGRRARWLSLPR
ncbi:carbonic anhydrase, partial [Frankia sp. CcWB2]